MNTRLQQFLAAENITQAQLADSLNVARAGVSHIIAGRNKPSYDFLSALLHQYPTLNAEWLMLGKGKMYKDLQEKIVEKIQEQPAGLLFDDFDEFGTVNAINDDFALVVCYDGEVFTRSKIYQVNANGEIKKIVGSIY